MESFQTKINCFTIEMSQNNGKLKKEKKSTIGKSL